VGSSLYCVHLRVLSEQEVKVLAGKPGGRSQKSNSRSGVSGAHEIPVVGLTSDIGRTGGTCNRLTRPIKYKKKGAIHSAGSKSVGEIKLDLNGTRTGEARTD